jgi:hypothetical protein
MILNRAALVLAAAAAAPLLWFARPDFVEPAAAWLFIATIWIGLLPWYRHLRQQPSMALPFLPLITLFYIVFFALPPFLIEAHWWSLGGATADRYGIDFARITTFTGFLVFAGVLALLGTYYSMQPVVRRISVRYRLPKETSWPRISVVLWLLGAAYILFLYVPFLRANSSLAQIMIPSGFFVTGALFVAWQKDRLRDFEKLAYWAVFIPLQLLIHVYEGLITPIILLFLFLLTLYWSVSRKLGVVVLLVFFFGLYIFPILKLSNVFIVENSPSVASRVSDKISALGIAAALFSEGVGAPEGNSVFSSLAGKNVIPPLLRRMSLIVLLQYSVDWTPERIPHLDGETLKNLLTNPVPRFLWKDKPPEIMGQWFGHKYRILMPDDQRTSINLPWLVEFYINFGWIGVVLGMAAVGAVMALLERLLLRAEMTDLELVAGWALLFRLFYQESNISLMLGGFVLQAVAFLTLLYAALWLAARIGAPASRL